MESICIILFGEPCIGEMNDYVPKCWLRCWCRIAGAHWWVKKKAHHCTGSYVWMSLYKDFMSTPLMLNLGYGLPELYLWHYFRVFLLHAITFSFRRYVPPSLVKLEICSWCFFTPNQLINFHMSNIVFLKILKFLIGAQTIGGRFNIPNSSSWGKYLWFSIF